MSETDSPIYTRRVTAIATVIALLNAAGSLPEPTLAGSLGTLTGSAIGALLVAGLGKVAYVKLSGVGLRERLPV